MTLVEVPVETPSARRLRLLEPCLVLLVVLSTWRITPVILSHFLYNLLIFGDPG